MNAAKTASLKRLAPVVLPVLLLSSLTIAVRLATVAQSGSGSQKGAPSYALNSGSSFNSTEATFLQYAEISDLIDKQEDTTALAKLRALQNAPISADGNTFHSEKIRMFSPQMFLMGLGNRIERRVGVLKQSGKDTVAREYIKSLYAIGDTVLASKTPTLRGLELVHHFHGLASKSEATLYPQYALVGLVTASYQYNALRFLWEHQILPQLDLQSNPEDTSSKERVVAERLSEEYRDAWSRIRAGEA